MNSFGELKATKQYVISFSIGRYSNNVICDVISMQDHHIMLGHPSQFDRNANYDRRNNRVFLDLNKRKYKLSPLIIFQVYKDKKHVKESMKKFKR